MDKLLSKIESPRDLAGLSNAQLEQLAGEMREVLCNLVASRTAHFASNLGVVELCLALHTSFDFSRDRLIWDTGHQIYPHKLITGRYHEFSTMRSKGGLMGYPNPHESDYDLFMTGHAGSSISTMLGIKVGDDLLPGQSDRHAVVVIGDGAFPSGIVYEAMNNVGGLRKNLLVVLNDNQMSICPRVGGMGEYLDRLRVNSLYTGLKSEVLKILNKVPLFGDPAERFLAQIKEAVKAGLHGGMLFEELNFRYIGPVDGHNIAQLRKYLAMVKDAPGPVLLHVVTQKGHGFQPAAEDPVLFHTPAPFTCEQEGILEFKKSSAKAYTDVVSQSIHEQMQANPKVTVMTAAMCQGTKLEAVREAFPDRFFDTGICESHTVAFAAGQAKAGLRPIVDIYSTFLQRSYDQIFQEVALQNLPVTFVLDRAGLTGPDGPTHHGAFDLGYMRVFPNMVVMAPGDAHDTRAMIEFALRHDTPCAIRYPKTTAETIPGARTPIELGRAEVIDWGHDGMIVACGTLVNEAIKAAATLREEGLDVGVINARFVKPLDTETILRAVATSPFVVTVEEAALAAGFGSAVVEAATDAAIGCTHVRRLGVPDHFIEHAERGELLADLGLNAAGIADTCRKMAARTDVKQPDRRRVS
jgi:1-deoxy-D-xylulose-5-phosphate synthase